MQKTNANAIWLFRLLLLVHGALNLSLSFGVETPCPQTIAVYEPDLRLALVNDAIVESTEGGENSDILEALFSPDGQFLVLFPAYGPPCIWSFSTSQCAKTSVGSYLDTWGWASTVGPNSSPRLLAYQTEKKSIQHIDPLTGNILHSFPLQLRTGVGVSTLPGAGQVFSPNGKYLLIVADEEQGNTKVPFIMDVHSGATVSELLPYKGKEMPFRAGVNTFSSDGSLVATCSHKGNVRIENATTGKLVLGHVLLGNEGERKVDRFAFSPTSRYLAVQTKAGKSWLFDLHTQDKSALEGMASGRPSFSPSENALLLSDTQKILILDPNSKKEKAILMSSEESLGGAFWNEAGELVVQILGDRFIVFDPNRFLPIYEMIDNQADLLSIPDPPLYAATKVGLSTPEKHIALWTPSEQFKPNAQVGDNTLFSTKDDEVTISVRINEEIVIVQFQ